jgi:UDP-glucose 4-epimerase
LALVLVTGGAGFIGSNISRYCLERGYEVRVLDNLATGSEANLRGLTIQLANGNVTDDEAIDKATKGVKYIFHQAAVSASPMFFPDPSQGLIVNALGFAKVLASAVRNGVEKVVYALTSSMYGNSPVPWVEDNLKVSDIPNIYASSLLDRSFIAKQIEKASEVKTVGLVYFSVYGPNEAAKGNYANIVSQFLWAMKRGQSPVLYGDGSQTRDFIHVEDVARANVLAAESDYSGGFVNLGTGTETSMKAIAEKLGSLLHSSINPVYKPNPIYGYCYRTLADTSKASKMIGFEAVVGIDQGLKTLVEFYRGKEIPDIS